MKKQCSPTLTLLSMQVDEKITESEMYKSFLEIKSRLKKIGKGTWVIKKKNDKFEIHRTA
jgi:hypothetical protein